MANADRCVCCGAIIPEGSHVCPNCKVAVKPDDRMDAYAYLAKYMKENMQKKPKPKKKDLVEVVRCKDCEHWIPGDSLMGDSFDDMQRIGGCPYVRFRRLENEFCSYGERKDNERKAD